MKKLVTLIAAVMTMFLTAQSISAQSDTLVVYFSATGNTKSAAESIAKELNADLYEIVPVQPYTSADLNYNSRTSRTSIERNDRTIRPEISGSPIDLSGYKLIVTGYPIWWNDMPRIMYTFFDTYNLSGKTVAPFCTSGGSGLSGTGRTIAGLEPNATVLDGLSLRSSGRNSAAEISEWAAKIKSGK